MPTTRKLKMNNVALVAVMFILFLGLPITIALVRIGFNPFTQADPTLTPQNIVEALNWDTSITIIFETPDKESVSMIKYGSSANDLNLMAQDLRDPAITSQMHYINIENLAPNTTYYYKIVVNNSNEFDNNGAPFTFKTLSIPPTDTPNIDNDVAIGSLLPITENCIIYAHAISTSNQTSQTVSTYTSSNGSFTILRNMFLDKITRKMIDFGNYNRMLVFAKCNSQLYGGKIVDITKDAEQISFDSTLPVKFYSNSLTGFGEGTLPTVSVSTRATTPTPIRSPFPTSSTIFTTVPTTIFSITPTPTSVLPQTDLPTSSSFYYGILLLVAGSIVFFYVNKQQINNAK